MTPRHPFPSLYTRPDERSRPSDDCACELFGLCLWHAISQEDRDAMIARSRRPKNGGAR